MTLSAVTIQGYRSIKDIHFPIGALTVFTGKNGTGKTNLYRALQLIHCAANNTITRAIAEEGGISSVLWAGQRPKKDPVRLKLAATLGDAEYKIEIGLPSPTQAALDLEPLIKYEELATQAGSKRVIMMKREGPSAWLRDEAGKRQTYDNQLLPSETALASFQDTARFWHVDSVRREILNWRFYHEFRTDQDSPCRKPSLSVTTPILSSNGHDLAAVFATVQNIAEDTNDIDDAINDAFPGASLDAFVRNGSCEIAMQFPDMPRPFSAQELSDGTLAYLCLVASLIGYRRPSFIALNEPEASLHPELVAPLARLITKASEQSQVWIVTHSESLAVQLSEESLIIPRKVVKKEGATSLVGLSVTGEFLED